MYIRDGIVYGGDPKQPIKVEQVKALSDMMLFLLFNNGELLIALQNIVY